MVAMHKRTAVVAALVALVAPYAAGQSWEFSASENRVASVRGTIEAGGSAFLQYSPVCALNTVALVYQVQSPLVTEVYETIVMRVDDQEIETVWSCAPATTSLGSSSICTLESDKEPVVVPLTRGNSVEVVIKGGTIGFSLRNSARAINQAQASCPPGQRSHAPVVRPVRASARPVAAAPPAGRAMPAFGQGAVNARCAAEWSTDFAMQEFCRGMHRDAYDALRGIWTAATRDIEPAVDRCFSEWSTGESVDWHMTHFCVDQQLTAWRNLR